MDKNYFTSALGRCLGIAALSIPIFTLWGSAAILPPSSHRSVTVQEHRPLYQANSKHRAGARIIFVNDFPTATPTSPGPTPPPPTATPTSNPGCPAGYHYESGGGTAGTHDFDDGFGYNSGDPATPGTPAQGGCVPDVVPTPTPTNQCPPGYHYVPPTPGPSSTPGPLPTTGPSPTMGPIIIEDPGTPLGPFVPSGTPRPVIVATLNSFDTSSSSKALTTSSTNPGCVPDVTPTATPQPTTGPDNYALAWDEGQTPVAIGGLFTPSHQAKFTLTITHADGSAASGFTAPAIKILSGGRGPRDTIAARVNYDLNPAITDSNGRIKGTFTSGNREEYTTIGFIILRPKPRDPDNYSDQPSINPPMEEVTISATIGQVWNQLSDEELWEYDPYFDYDTPSTITYKMAYTRNNVQVPIESHALTPTTTAISGYEWNPDAGEDWDGDGYVDGDYESKDYSEEDADRSGFDQWSPLVEWGDVSSSGGTYNADQTIHWNDDFIMDFVHFWMYDEYAYGPNGYTD